MDTWRVSNSVSFINRSWKRRKASKFCLPTLGTSALLIRRRERWEALHPPYNMPLQSFPRTSRNFTKFLSYVPRCNRPTRFSEDGGEPSARVSRKGSCPRQRWMLERGRENGERRRRVFHRVLKLRFWHCLDIGFYEVTEPDEKERERESGKGLGRGKAFFPGRRKFTPSC